MVIGLDECTDTLNINVRLRDISELVIINIIEGMLSGPVALWD